ncbi:hypothetical protein TKK_0013502 [Trichogramma kaykai]
MYLCFLDICSSTSKPVGSRKQSRTLTIVFFRLSALKSKINIEACLKKKTKPNDNHRLPPGKCLKVKVFFADPTNVLMFSRCLQLNVEACWKQKTKQNNNYRLLPAECFKVKGIIMQVQQCSYASPMHSAQRQSLLKREDEAKR